MPSVPVIRSFRRTIAALATVSPLLLGGLAFADDSDWPREFDSSSGTFVIYQPQPEELTGDLLTGRAAFSLKSEGEAQPTFGVLWFIEHVEIDRDSSFVTVSDLDVTRVRLPGITPADASRYEKLVEAEAAKWNLSGSLEELQAGLAAAEKERASVAGLVSTPPRIVFTDRRAILVVYDGEPMLEPIEGSRLERVANTPYAVIRDAANGSYYLNGANLWYRATGPRGPWTPVSKPPDEVRAVVPPDTASADQIEGPPPEIVTSIEPAELISIDGQPNYAPLVDGELLYVTNTESDVLREVSTQSIYLLIAGRWYRSKSTDGPWTFVRADQLPKSFTQVPLDSPKGNILASISGTDQADDAVADAEIPQTSSIRRDDSGFQVIYDGSPRFEPIEGTRLEYAVNTDAEVILADDRYYACDQGVWYISDSPNGPWHVSDTRPLGVDDIPPSCPVYNVRYVYIYDSSPSAIYMGYLPGYLGCYPYYGTVVYGTGYRYHSWRGRKRFFPRPCTWGFHARYNPWLSRWSFGYSFSSGFLRVSWGPGRDPRGIHRRPLWFGPGGYRRPLLFKDMSLQRTRRIDRKQWRAADRTPMNLYRRSGNATRVAPTVFTRGPRPFEPTARPARVPNDVFAGKDGNVYRRDDRGGWKISRGRSWVRWVPSPVPSPTPATPAPQGSVAPASASPTPYPGTTLPPGSAPARPVEPSVQPRFPSGRPAPPAISPAPGDLERDNRARQRTTSGALLAPAKPVARPVEPQASPKKGAQPEGKP